MSGHLSIRVMLITDNSSGGVRACVYVCVGGWVVHAEFVHACGSERVRGMLQRDEKERAKGMK